MTTTLLDEVYREYKKETNMTLFELLNWSKNPCSKKASLDRRPLNRNLKLLRKPKDRWTMTDIQEAKKAISFLRRHKRQPSGDIVKGCGVSKRTIALKNWAYDPNKR